jgi:hypothetical protein
MGVILGLSHQGENIHWGGLRTGCCGECLDLRGRNWQEAEEDCKMRSFIICLLHQMLLGYKILVRKPEEKRPLRRHRHKWEDIMNSRMVLREIGLEGVDHMHLAKNRDKLQAFMNMVMNSEVS